jgi:transposase
MIAAADYAALRDARSTLTTMADGLWDAIRDATPVAASDMTRVAALCEHAEQAIFDLFNTAGAHLDDPESVASLFPARPT